MLCKSFRFAAGYHHISEVGQTVELMLTCLLHSQLYSGDHGSFSVLLL